MKYRRRKKIGYRDSRERDGGRRVRERQIFQFPRVRVSVVRNGQSVSGTVLP